VRLRNCLSPSSKPSLLPWARFLRGIGERILRGWGSRWRKGDLLWVTWSQWKCILSNSVTVAWSFSLFYLFQKKRILSKSGIHTTLYDAPSFQSFFSFEKFLFIFAFGKEGTVCVFAYNTLRYFPWHHFYINRNRVPFTEGFRINSLWAAYCLPHMGRLFYFLW